MSNGCAVRSRLPSLSSPGALTAATLLRTQRNGRRGRVVATPVAGLLDDEPERVVVRSLPDHRDPVGAGLQNDLLADGGMADAGGADDLQRGFVEVRELRRALDGERSLEGAVSREPVAAGVVHDHGDRREGRRVMPRGGGLAGCEQQDAGGEEGQNRERAL